MKPQINLLFVTSKLFIGGAEVVIKNLCHHLDENKFNLSVCCLKERGTIGDDLYEEGYDIECLPTSAKEEVDYFTFRKLLAIVKKKKIDIIHSHATHSLVDSCLSKYFCSLGRARPIVIHTFHRGEYPLPQKRRHLLERFFWRFTDQLIAVGDFQKQQIKSIYHIPDHRIVTVWNGVSPPNYTIDNSFLDFLRNFTGTIIGTIGTLFKQKGLSYLLETASILKKRGHNCVFIVAGEGPLRDELEAKKKALGLEKSVYFLGWVPNASLNILPRVDIFFQPSLWEAMSVVILEAMMNGKPIVATKVGENEHVIDHGRTGFLTDPKSIDQMVFFLEKFLNDASLQNQMGTAAKEVYGQHFTAEAMALRHEKMYLDVLSSKRENVV